MINIELNIIRLNFSLIKLDLHMSFNRLTDLLYAYQKLAKLNVIKPNFINQKLD